MTFPTVVGRQNSVDSANDTSHTVTWPTVSGGILVDDIAIIVCGIDGAGTATFPDGSYVELMDQASNGVQIAVAFRRMSGGESGTFTVTTSGSQGGGYVVLIIRGGHLTTNPEIGTRAGALSAAPNPPSLSPSWGAEDILWIALGSNDSNPVCSAAPTNYANLQNALWNQATHGAGAFTAERDLNAASDDPGAFTLSSSDGWNAALVAIRPAVVGPNEVTAAIGLTLAVAPVADTAHEATAALGLGVALAATVAIGHEVTSSVPLGLDLAPVVSAPGVAPAEVTASIPLSLTVGATADTAHEVTASVPMSLDVTSTADTAHEVTTAIPLAVNFDATTQVEHEATADVSLSLSLAPVVDAPIPGAPAEVTAAIPLSLGVAATADTAHEVTASFPLAVDATSTATIEHEATATISLGLALAPVVDAPTVGVAEVTASIPLATDIAAVTQVEHEVTAAPSLSLVLAATADTTHEVTASIPLTVAFAPFVPPAWSPVISSPGQFRRGAASVLVSKRRAQLPAKQTRVTLR